MPRPHPADNATRPLYEDGPRPPAVRTYREIATLLSQRAGAPISLRSVKRMCRAAEASFMRTILTDAVDQHRPAIRPTPVR